MALSAPAAPGTAPLAPVPGAAPARRPAARQGGRLLPYLLVLPAAVVLGTLLAWPLVRLVLLSVREFGLAQQFGQPARFVGLDNYARIVRTSSSGPSSCARWRSARSPWRRRW